MKSDDKNDKNKDDTRPRTGSSAPPKDDPSGRPLTEDEKVDEAIRERPAVSLLDIAARMIDEMHVMDARRTGRHA